MGSGEQGRRRARAGWAVTVAACVALAGCALVDEQGGVASTPTAEPTAHVSASTSTGGAEVGGENKDPSEPAPTSDTTGSTDTPTSVDASTGSSTPASTDPPGDPSTAEPGAAGGSTDATSTTGAATALAALAELKVKGRAPKTRYDRDAFQYRAVDLDRNGCDVRNDILRRDLSDVVLKPGTHGCVVESGVLTDPYSALRIDFRRGSATSNDVQIDHVVALSDAWQKGAQRWSKDTLATFGNDPLNLLAVDGPLNKQKGDGDAATWLPPNTSFRCQYVARQIAVKHAYGLWVTAAEKTAMERVLGACPDEPLPTDDSVVRVVVLGDRPTDAPSPTTKPSGEDDLDPDYGTCKEAIRHGAGPYYADRDPEYYYYRDGDGDGVTCERP